MQCAPSCASCQHQRVAHVVAVAHICKMQSLRRAEVLLQGHEVCQRLARMFKVGQRIDTGTREFAAISVMVSCE